MPGTLQDTRFNNYVLEHDYRWMTGQDSSLWDAPIFYPYPLTLAFSDNHFGSMFFYAAFRVAGMDRETALQAWYLLSYFLSFAAAAFVLKKLDLKPLAVGMGAFFFTFGLPQLGQELHVQLFYRFCIPLACYAFWLFSQKQHFKHLVFTLFWLVWQFYLSIYLGIFLSLLLIVIALGMPFTQRPSFSNILMYWPHTFRKAWQNSKISSNILSLLAMMIILLALFVLLRPYAMAVDLYGFSRSWGKVYPMIPRIQSYFIADGVTLWQPFASFTAKITDHRWEHQLFIGIPAVILLVAGFIWQFRSPHRKLAFLFIGAVAVLVLLTLNVKGFTLYKFLWPLPGFSSLRAVTRIILVLMWPIALFISIEADALLRIPSRSVIFTTIVLLLLALMAAESIFYNHTTFSKADAQARIQTLKEQLPTTFPEDPVLYVWDANDTGPSYSEVDAMLLSQDLGWPTVNGYSGNAPNGSGLVDNCNDISTRIKGYMNFAKITDPSFYNDLLSRVAPISPQKCTWYKPVP
ncbi:MAG TPA: hypothetical protein VMC62_01600 [Longilinea sp.]|nr:hypothetical protein [Longilinea sp.]